jgi:hypothetical protein
MTEPVFGPDGLLVIPKTVYPPKAKPNGATQRLEVPAQDTEQPKNLLREIVLKPSEWEGVPVPPRRWFARNRIPMREVTGLGGDGGIGKTQVALQGLCAVRRKQPTGLALR